MLKANLLSSSLYSHSASMCVWPTQIGAWPIIMDVYILQGQHSLTTVAEQLWSCFVSKRRLYSLLRQPLFINTVMYHYLNALLSYLYELHVA